MPLKRGSSNATRSQNIREMIDAGHPPAQAESAAYRQQRQSGGKPRKAAKPSFKMAEIGRKR